jgi:hypothetical protein
VNQDRVGFRGYAARVALMVVVVAVLALPPLAANGQLQPLTDLLAIGQGGGEDIATATVQQNPEPPLTATPRAKCGAGSHPEPDLQGRVPAGSATNGLTCNVSLVAHQGNSGGFKVWRYIDPQGHECAFYDTALLFPFNAVRLSGESHGVAVLDMSNPAHPVQTDTLTEEPMLSPHESLNLNQKRGLLAAVLGNPSTYPGLVSIYDVHTDCRHPKLQSTKLVARLGHESGFTSDGKTFYATSTATKSITAVDVTDPKDPHSIWHGNITSHGMDLRDDGNRAYLADSGSGQMVILDTSQIQARKPNPQTREISRLTWKSAAIPQNAYPFTEHGHPYVLEFDEYTAGLRGDNSSVGAARIIDIADERKPRVVSNLRLDINNKKDAYQNDPGADSPVQGYAAHYCNLPTRVDPKVVACSFIVSGLRVFDISDLVHPKEIAYYVAPTEAKNENGYEASDFSMSRPEFVPSQREIWFSDGPTGFYSVRVAKDVWPADSAGNKPGCLARTAPIGPSNIGRVRLGLTRTGLLRRVPLPGRRGKRVWSWCVKGGKGRVSAAFTRGGRVALVTTTAPRHGNRRIHPGTGVRALRRAYPRRRALGRTLLRANPRSPRLFGIRRGKVRYIAVTSRRTIGKRKTLRSYLRYAGVVAR